MQKRFVSNTKNVVEAIEEMGNPFLDDSSDLVALDTKLIMSETVVNNMQAAEQLGKTQYEAFVDERISGSSKPFYDPIQKNNMTLFKVPVFGLWLFFFRSESLLLIIVQK